MSLLNRIAPTTNGTRKHATKVTVSIETITPVTAQRWLAEHHQNNRPLKKTHVGSLARAMRNGEWMLNGGVHRLRLGRPDPQRSATKNQPIYLLREKLIRARADHSSHLTERYIKAIVIKAWNYTRAGKTMKTLRFSPDAGELFPVVD